MSYDSLLEERISETEQALGRVLAEQEREVVTRLLAGLRPLLLPRWDEQLAAAIRKAGSATASSFVSLAIAELDVEGAEPSQNEWLDVQAETSAEAFNRHTAEDLGAALDHAESDPFLDARTAVESAMAIAAGSRLDRLSSGLATNTAAVATNDVAEYGGFKFKTWHTSSGNPRDKHQRMNGEKVGIDDEFSNGLRWPGGRGPADEVANCKCRISYTKE